MTRFPVRNLRSDWFRLRLQGFSATGAFLFCLLRWRRAPGGMGVAATHADSLRLQAVAALAFLRPLWGSGCRRLAVRGGEKKPSTFFFLALARLTQPGSDSRFDLRTGPSIKLTSAPPLPRTDRLSRDWRRRRRGLRAAGLASRGFCSV